MNRIVSIGSVGLGITLVAAIVVAVLSRRLFTDRPRLAACNRWIGFGIDGVQGALVLLILVGGVLVVEPMSKKRVVARDDNGPFGRAVAQHVVNIAKQTRESRLGPAIIANNPFEQIPPLARMQRKVRVVSDPEQVNELMKHPSLEQLKESPKIRSAIDSLIADPEIQQLLKSGKPVDPLTAMSLMNNPAILQLLDDPNFVIEMSKIVSELDPELQESLESLK